MINPLTILNKTLDWIGEKHFVWTNILMLLSGLSFLVTGAIFLFVTGLFMWDPTLPAWIQNFGIGCLTASVYAFYGSFVLKFLPVGWIIFIIQDNINVMPVVVGLGLLILGPYMAVKLFSWRR